MCWTNLFRILSLVNMDFKEAIYFNLMNQKSIEAIFDRHLISFLLGNFYHI